MSQHIGDMTTLETQVSLLRAVAQMQQLFHITPQQIVCDLHPAYQTTKLAHHLAAQGKGDVRVIPVQHHHAHLAAIMAEHGLSSDAHVIGCCFDGTGYGLDGAIWGGEFFVAGYSSFERVAHLAYFPLPGGDAAIRKPYRAALAALWAAGIEWNAALPPVQTASATELSILRRQLETNLNCAPTSSMGRLFDIVAALGGLCQHASYEAQAAIELEAHVGMDTADSYAFALTASGSFDAAPVLQAVVEDVKRGVPRTRIATRFHNAVANLICESSVNLRARTDINRVALSGGVFQNIALVARVVQHLRAAGFELLLHRRVPPNDGGLALGQVMVAAHQERA